MELRSRHRIVVTTTKEEGDVSSDEDQPVAAAAAAAKRRKGKAKVVVDDAMEVDEEKPAEPDDEEDAEVAAMNLDTRMKHKAKNLATARNRAAFYARYSGNSQEVFSRRRFRRQGFDEDEIMGDGTADAAALPSMEPPSPKIIDWTPSRPSSQTEGTPRKPASLYSMCIDLLGQNVDSVESLAGVPDVTKRIIIFKLYELGKITVKSARLFMAGPISQIILPDCSKISDQEFTELMESAFLDGVETLDLGFCGRAVSDQTLNTFALPGLRKLRLHGNYRITDAGLRALLRSATRGLTDVELVECCCITELVVQELATFHGPYLQSLSLEECTAIEGRKVLPFIQRLPELTLLSVSNMTDVTDGVLSELVVSRGPKLEELNISHCSVTDQGMAAVGACCPALKSLHLEGLNLSDVTLQHLSESCKVLSNLSLDSGSYSDEGLADFITAAGSSLRNLSLASIEKAGDKTLVALAKHASRSLETLNVSFCRKMTEDGLGFLADSCPNLEELRLFGCTQVTERFVSGHSNNRLRLLGERGGSLSWRMNIRAV